MSIALFSVLGVVLGAALQYTFTRVLEDRRHYRELRTRAYSDYLRGVAEVHHLFVQPQAPRERAMLAQLTDAKARVCLYGSEPVVSALASFERQGRELRTPEQQAAFVQLLNVMRNKAVARSTDLASVMLGG